MMRKRTRRREVGKKTWSQKELPLLVDKFQHIGILAGVFLTRNIVVVVVVVFAVVINEFIGEA